MVRVVSAAPGPKTKEFTCRCRAVLEVSAADLTYRHDSRDGDAVSFVCPECKREEWVSVDLIPQSIMKDVPK